MKTCNRCGTMNLEWDMPYHETTGKWKLTQHKNKYGKWCGKVPEKVMFKMLTIDDVTLCELCSNSFGGLCKSKSAYEKHLKLWHPNGEILTDLDYKMVMGLSKHNLKYWKHDLHYSKYAKDL